MFQPSTALCLVQPSFQTHRLQHGPPGSLEHPQCLLDSSTRPAKLSRGGWKWLKYLSLFQSIAFDVHRISHVLGNTMRATFDTQELASHHSELELHQHCFDYSDFSAKRDIVWDSWTDQRNMIFWAVQHRRVTLPAESSNEARLLHLQWPVSPVVGEQNLVQVLRRLSGHWSLAVSIWSNLINTCRCTAMDTYRYQGRVKDSEMPNVKTWWFFAASQNKQCAGLDLVSKLHSPHLSI